MEEGTLLEVIKRQKIDEARQLFEQGEKLQKNLPYFEKNQVYLALTIKKAYDLIEILIKDGFVETDMYEYESYDFSIFVPLFRNLGESPEELEFIETFIAALDNVNDAVQDKTLLDLALYHNVPVEVVKKLIVGGCDVNYRDNSQANYLHRIIQEYNIKEDIGSAYIELFLSEGIDINEGNVVDETPLHFAVNKSKEKYIELLLANGADPNQQDKRGESPFYCALAYQVCNNDLYRTLTKYAQPDFDMVNNEGMTLLTSTLRMRSRASEADIDVIKSMIADGADIYQESPYYGEPKSALDWITEMPGQMLEAIIETGSIDIDRKDNKGNCILHKVCAYNVNYDQEVARQVYRKAKLLIEKGADVNSTNDLDQTPMMLAAQDNLKAKTVELLLKS